jgi:hypothetical protein
MKTMKILYKLLRNLRSGVARQREIIGTWSFRAPSNDNLSLRSRAFYSPDRKAS